ncbi:hypothetical protein ACHAXH_000515 [Discostella pseudostelligera]
MTTWAPLPHQAYTPQAHPHEYSRNDSALSDSCTTSHFPVNSAHAINIRLDPDPITVQLPDGRSIQSTHTCNLDIPWLRQTATNAHIVPGLIHALLVSTAKLCDAGYTVLFDTLECRDFDGPEIVLKGGRDPTTKLWRLPLHPATKPTTECTANVVIHMPANTHTPTPIGTTCANNVHTIPHLQNRVKYMHQAFFCLPIQTLLRTANLGFLNNLPFLQPDLIHKHLTNSPATAKGHLKLRPTGHYSTQSPTATSHPKTADIFCFAARADKQHGTFYTDCTGNLPVRALDGQQLFFVAFAYDPNYIFALPINSTSNSHIMEAFKQVFKTLTTQGYKPTFNVTDNQAAEPIKDFMQQQNGKVQFVEPNNHRVNTAERAIQTFKNHFISSLCTTNKDFPFQLWNHLTEQAIITCNILRRSRLNPEISVYEQLHGHKYDWNAHPLAPPGTRAIIHSSTLTRTSWGPRGIDAWYCGPALDHYRCNHFYSTSPRSRKNFYDALRKRLFTSIILAIRKVTTAPPKTPPTYDPATLPWSSSKGAPAPHTTSTNPTAPHLTGTWNNTAPNTHCLPEAPTQGPTSTQTPTEAPSTTPTAQAAPPPTIPTTTPALRRSPRIVLISPPTYSQAALNTVAIQQLHPVPNNHTIPWTCEHFCAPVIHPITGKSITNYKKLAADPVMRDTWARAFGKEFGNLALGDNATKTPGTDSIFVLMHDQIRQIPRDHTITYTQIVVDYRPQKTDPNRVRLTAGGNLIEYPGELTTQTADLTTTKMLWNSIISTKDARYLCLEIKNFYLGTPMDRFEYMKMPLDIFPPTTVAQYNLMQHVLEVGAPLTHAPSVF